MDKRLELKDKLHDQDVDPEDRVLAYARYTRHSGLLVAHNLDPHSVREIACPIDRVPGILLDRVDLAPAYDTHKFTTDRAARVTLADEGVSMELQPLQSAVVKLLFRSA